MKRSFTETDLRLQAFARDFAVSDAEWSVKVRSLIQVADLERLPLGVDRTFAGEKPDGWL